MEFSVVSWELLTGKYPFKGMTSGEVARHVAIEKQSLALPLRGPKPLLILMTWCFVEIPSERPTFHKVATGLASMRADEVKQQRAANRSHSSSQRSAWASLCPSPYPSSKLPASRKLPSRKLLLRKLSRISSSKPSSSKPSSGSWFTPSSNSLLNQSSLRAISLE